MCTFNVFFFVITSDIYKLHLINTFIINIVIYIHLIYKIPSLTYTTVYPLPKLCPLST